MSFTSWGANHTSTNVLSTLKVVWNSEIPIGSESLPPADKGLAPPPIVTAHPTNRSKNGKKRIAQMTPQTLNSVWNIAARREETFPTIAAILAVTVVPIFSPSTIAAAMSNPIHPLAHIISVSATMADDDCTTTVSTVPITMKSSTDQIPFDEKSRSHSSTCGYP